MNTNASIVACVVACIVTDSRTNKTEDTWRTPTGTTLVDTLGERRCGEHICCCADRPGPISLSTVPPYHYTALSLFHSLPLATATLLCLPCCYSCGHRMGRYSTRLSVGGRLGRCLWWVSSCFAASRSNQRVWTMGCLKHGTSATVGSS